MSHVLDGRVTTASSRLRPPSPSASDLPRERLLRWLDHDPTPVTLVSGHAGAGKTTLLTAWATAATDGGRLVAWYALDRFDDDPALLWGGILAALRATGRFPPTSPLHDLVASPHEVAGSFVDAVVEAVEELGAPVVLVLDDVHLLTSSVAAESLAQLARRTSRNFQLVLASRSDPPIGLARLRLEGRLRELRGEDLAFTDEETTAYLAGRGFDLSSASIRTLQARTEGWVAGVRIAALAIAGSGDRSGLIERFGGDDHAVADYLVSEVLAGLSEDRRRFLLRTSVCVLLRVDLARELSGRDDAGALLDALERDHVMTRRQGRTREVYRYHELFRTYLLAELRRTEPAVEQGLHRVAAAWHARHGEPLRAIEHLIRGGQLADIHDVVGADAVGALLDGHGKALEGLLATVPPAGRSVPAVALLGAATALERCDPAAADRWLAGVDVDAVVEDDPQLGALAATVAVWRARSTDRVEDALARMESTSATVTGTEEYDLLALHERGVARLYVGRYDEGVDDLERAAGLARLTGRDALQLSCLSFLAGAIACRSQLVTMRVPAEAAIELATRRGWAGSQAVAHAHLLIGWSAYLQADQDLATEQARLALASFGPLVDPDVELGVLSLDLVVGAEGGGSSFESLRSYLGAFERLAGAQMAPALLAYAVPLVLRICLDLGERVWAQAVVEQVRGSLPDPGEPALLRAMVLHDAGRLDAATGALRPIVRGEARCHVITTDVWARLLAADIELRRRAPTPAHELLAAAVELASHEEVIRPFLRFPAVLESLSVGRGRFGRLDDFVARILEAAPEPTGAEHQAERLTPGELTVLRELPSLLSLREIAEARVVSVNTVKTHLRSIYRKLGVESRREAVEVARRRGLL